MITADASFYLRDNEYVTYTVEDIACVYRYDPLNELFLVDISPVYVSADEQRTINSAGIVLTKSAVDAKTPSGSDPSDELLYQIEECVIDYLDGLTSNTLAGVGFTH